MKISVKMMASLIAVCCLMFGSLSAQNKDDDIFQNHRKGTFSIGVNVETMLRSMGTEAPAAANLDIGYHITDKWMLGAKLKLNQTANTFDIGGSLYSRYYLMDFGKRKRASWFVQGELYYGKDFNREPYFDAVSNSMKVDRGFKLGTGVDVAITKNLLFTSHIYYGRERQRSYNQFNGYSDQGRNILGISAGFKWQLGKK